MFVLELYDPTSGAVTGYVRTDSEAHWRRPAKRCDRASHFLSERGATLTRLRLTRHTLDPIRVTSCLCPAPGRA